MRSVFSYTLMVQIYCTSVNCTSTTFCSLLLDLKVHSLRNLFLLFLAQQMSSDCLGLLLGLTLPLHPLSCQTGLIHLNETAAEHIFSVWICVKVLGEKVASGCLLSGKHNELLRHMMIFSILLALLAVGRDFVHEFGSRGDLIVPCCTDLQTATHVSGVQEGKDSLRNQRHSCRIQLSWDILVLLRVGEQLK